MSYIKTWDGLISTEATNEILRELALAHLGEVPTSSYQDIVGTLRSYLMDNDYRSLCEFNLKPSTFECPLTLYHLGQVLAFYKKRVDLDLGIDRRAVAMEKFEKSERTCATMNAVFRSWQDGKFQFLPYVEGILHASSQKIARVLGRCPSVDELQVRFGPGATTQVGKRMACAKVKLSQKPACSEELVPIVVQLLESIPGYTFAGLRNKTIECIGEEPTLLDVHIQPGKVSFVPKSCKEDRLALVEPWLNSIGQLGIGDHMAKCLRYRAGIDLTNQSLNKRLAREGSITGALATLDLSSASDNISTKLVEHLLPYDWFELLSRFRTGTALSPNREEKRLHKFSSMGNGFTFPLESLIFWAVTSSVCDTGDIVSVYGDDIICPSSKAEAVMRVLNCIGFTVNEEKSFYEGPFRESCGGDYLSGIDVRPCYIKGPLRGHDAFRLHNFYVRSGQNDFAALVRKHLDPDVVLTGPDGFGDGHLIGYDWQPSRKREFVERGYGGVIFDTWSYKKREFRKRLPGDAILPGYSVYTREGNTESVVQRLQREEQEARAWLINQDPDLCPSFYEALGYRFTSQGVPVNYVPGSKGCKRISIYTLALP